MKRLATWIILSLLPYHPGNPPFLLDAELLVVYGNAMKSLGQLNEMVQRLPDQERFIKAFAIKEALLSSAIEGIHTTIIDTYTQLLTNRKPSKQTQLVLNYTAALDTALVMIQKQSLPISTRVLLATHKTLMTHGEGDYADPGNYRKQSVRVGHLIPPQAPKVPELMGKLEHYINTDKSLPPLIKAGLAHVQFETIHPFIDGNGRIGRLLIVLMLVESGLLSAPILYPSYFFKKYQMDYYRNLDVVRIEGNFEKWILYYLKAIEQSAQDALRRAKDIEKLEAELKELIQKTEDFSKNIELAINGLTILFQSPVIDIKEMAKRLDKSYNTAADIIENFVTHGILHKLGDQKRNKLFQFKMYLDLLEKEFKE